jgi:hypothetical protein
MSLPELFQRTRQTLDLRIPPVDDERAMLLPGFPTIIPLVMQTQKVEFWCWAAVASSVSRHYAPASQFTQCLIANAVLGAGSCCLNENSPACNRMSTLEGALMRTGNLAPNGVKNGPATPDQLRAQIRDAVPRRVVGCGIRWADMRGHFVVIHGFSIDSNGVFWLAIADPRYGPSEYTYDAFVNRYRETGKWVFSYATEP